MLYRLYFILLLGLWTLLIYPVTAQDCSTQDVDAWITQADANYSADQYDIATIAYTCAIEVSDEQDAYAYQQRAVSNRMVNLFDEAISDINQSIALDPTQGVAYYIRGNMYLDFEQYELAIADYEQAIRSNFTSYHLHYSLGLAYLEIGDDELAKGQFQSAILADSHQGLSYIYLGEINFREGDIYKAIENSETGIYYSTGLSQSIGYLNRANITYLIGNHEAAIVEYSAGISAYRDNAELYLARANAYRATQNPDANTDYLRYIEKMQTEAIGLDTLRSINTFDMAKGRVYRSRFTLTAGSALSVSAEDFDGSGIDPLIVLLDPTGHPIIGDDDSGSGKNAVINRLPIEQSGTYTLLVTHSNTGHTGQIRVEMSEFANVAGQIITYQLAIGERAEIFAISNEGLGTVNLREFPSLGFDVLRQLPSGTQGTIINGPYKDDDFVWWQLELDDGTVGWVVERIGEEQTLFAAIDIGRTVIINVPQLNFRAEPTVNSEIVQSYFKEARVFLPVIGGPVEADGYTWWKVSLPQALEGWAVERAGNNQTLVVLLDR